MNKMLALALVLLGSQQSLAQNKWIEPPSTTQPSQLPAGKTRDGEWILSTGGQVRFSGIPRVHAVTQQGEETFGFMCEYEGKQTVIFALGYALNPNRFQQDMKFAVQFRADQNPVIVVGGMAISPEMLWVAPNPEMIDQLKKAKEVKFLASNIDKSSAIAFDWAFKLNNTADIVAKVMKACEQQPPTR